MKKIISGLFILIFSLSLCTVASAKIKDDAYLLSQSEMSALEDRSYALINEYDCFVAVYTAESLGSYYSAKSAAQDTLQALIDIYGSGFTNGGVIFYIAMETRDWHIHTTGNAWDMFNDAAMDEIENRAVEYLSDGEYYKAFDAYLDVASDVLEANANGESYAPAKKLSALFVYLAIAAIIAFVIAIVWVSILKSQLTSVRFQGDADSYRVVNSFNVKSSEDRFLYKNVTFVPRPKPSSSSGGGRIGGGGSRGGKF